MGNQNKDENERIIEISLSGAKYKFKAEDKVKNPKQVEAMILAELEESLKQIPKASISSNSLPALIISGLSISKKYIEAKKKHRSLIDCALTKISKLEESADNAIEKIVYKDKKDPVIRTISTNNPPPATIEEPLTENIKQTETLQTYDAAREPEEKNEYQKPIEQNNIDVQKPDVVKSKNIYTSKPDTNFLIPPSREQEDIDTQFLKDQARKLEKKLEDFSIRGEVKEIAPGPVITTFEYKPAPGIKISKIVNLENDIALALSALSVRIVAPIPGKNVIGIEVPNKKREIVRIREIIESDIFNSSKNGLPLCLGKDIDGNPFISDLTKMPHLLIAGATGTGKSVCLNAMITSLLYKCSPEDVKLLMIDPKRIELSLYNDIPHLITPVVTDMKKATNALNWAVKEMEQRYDLLAMEKVRNIDQYNAISEEKLPYIVIIIDELADLMMVSSRDVETALARLAQMARASGIHLILATQRPSVDVLTGVIKANFPTRISFQVSSKTDSRTILDANGAEALLGNGDMIFLPPGTSKIRRLHGAYISEKEVTDVIDFLKTQMEPEYIDDVTEAFETENESYSDEDYDPLYDKAVQFVTSTRQASISAVQRHLRIGFNRAARIIEYMERDNIVGPAQGSKPREIIAGSFDNI
ncbi:MAG: DNA translocase FtsK [Desulfobacteraceae bacterium]|nr:DNA translocase FtsK [Desulfobacteraceae bacterium]MCB9494594.1 DNA translocase FtsK [Desulfobacteraceae bacterium]